MSDAHDHLRRLLENAITGDAFGEPRHPHPLGTPDVWLDVLRRILAALELDPADAGVVIHPNALDGAPRTALIDACDELEMPLLELAVLPVGAVSVATRGTR